MLEYLVQIPGPTFLLYYAIFAFTILLLIYLYSQNDYTRSTKLPEPTSLTPIDIAILRKGIRGALNYSLLSLYWKKAIEVTPFVSSKSILIEQLPCEEAKLNNIEHVLYQYVNDKPKYHRHFYSPGIVKAVDEAMQPNIERLQHEMLAVDEAVIRRSRIAMIVGFALVESLGLLKLFLGTTNDKPIGFLILSMIVYGILILWMFNPSKIKRSALGEKFLKTCRRRFKWLKDPYNKKELFIDKNILYTLATFGVLKKIKVDVGGELEIPYELERSSASNFLHPARVSSYGNGCAGCTGGTSRRSSGGGWFFGCSGGCGSGCSGGCGGGCGGCGGCGG